MQVLQIFSLMLYFVLGSSIVSVFADVNDKVSENRVEKPQDIEFPEDVQKNKKSDQKFPMVGTGHLISFKSPKEFYLLVESHESTDQKSKHKHILKFSLSGLDHLNVNLSQEGYFELLKLMHSYGDGKLTYHVVKTHDTAKHKELPMASVILKAGKVNINDFFKKWVRINYLPKVAKPNVGWSKVDAFNYRSHSIENWYNKQSKHDIWLHRKGRPWSHVSESDTNE